MSDIANLMASFNLAVAKVPKQDLEAMVAQRLAAQGQLGAGDVAWLREQSGWSRAEVFRIAGAVRPPAPEFDEDATFLDRIQMLGQTGFVFDDLALGMIAAHGGNMTRFRKDVLSYAAEAGLDLPMPSLGQLSRRLHAEVPEQVRNGLIHGHRNRYTTTLRIRWEPDYVNQYVYVDEFILDLACLAPAAENESDFFEDNGDPFAPVNVYVGDAKRWMVPVRARLLVLQEAKSRFISSWALLTRPPTAVDTLALLGDALDVRKPDNGAEGLIGGRFDVLVGDNAGCFRAHVVENALRAAGSSLDIAIGYDPVAKATLERGGGGTLQRKIVVGRPGHLSTMQSRSGKDMLATATHHLLPFDTVLEATRRAVYECNYVDVHSTLGMTPYEAFTAGCPSPQPVPDEVIADTMLPGPRAKGKRKVLPDGVQVFNRRGFLTEQLARPDVLGEDVMVRVFHHRQDKVAVFKPIDRRVDADAAEFLGFAEDYSNISEAKRRQILNVWQAGTATIRTAASTASRLKQLSATTGDPAEVSLTEAAFVEHNRDTDYPTGDLLEATQDDVADEPKPARAKKIPGPDAGRRPHTKARKTKPVPTSDQVPATDADLDELDLLEDALDRSLEAPTNSERTDP